MLPGNAGDPGAGGAAASNGGRGTRGDYFSAKIGKVVADTLASVRDAGEGAYFSGCVFVIDGIVGGSSELRSAQATEIEEQTP